MPRLEVLDSSHGSGREIDAPSGGDLVDLCDEHYLPIPFSCRSCSCATCHIEVRGGAELLEPAAEEERDLLDAIGGSTAARLACQVKVNAGDGLVVIQPMEF